MDFKIVKLKDVCIVNQGLQIPISKRFKEKAENRYFYITVQFLKGNAEKYYIENPNENVKCNNNDILVVRTGNTGQVLTGISGCFHNNFFKVTPNYRISNRFLYFSLNNEKMYKKMLSVASGTTIPDLKHSNFYNLDINLPSLENQNKIVKILSAIDKKIELNDKIVQNIEKILENKFQEIILAIVEFNNYEEKTLYDLLEVIDNRGKTPPLDEEKKIPIIDVKSLNGNSRVIDYNKCTKFVSKKIYNSFFRSGHPKINDILFSTVGSIAEVKLFLENNGTIAQNVVSLRSKVEYNMFIYQYMKYKKKDFIALDIGSVQPSIKVTQFMNEKIKIPSDSTIVFEFEKLADILTKKILICTNKTKNLNKLKDTLMPKLLNGEIDLSKIELD